MAGVRAPAALRRLRGLRVFVVLVALGLFVAACSSGSDGSPGPDGAASSSELFDLLGRMPLIDQDGDLIFFVTATSLDAVDELAGLERSCASSDAMDDWLTVFASDLRDDVPVVPEVLFEANVAPLEDEFGIALCDLNWIAESKLGAKSPWLFSGDFDPDTVDAAVRADELWSDQLTLDSSGSSEFYDWGDEYMPERRSPYRRLSIGGQLALFPDEAAGRDIAAISTQRELMLDIVESDDAAVGDDRYVATALPILEANNPHSVLLLADALRWSELGGDLTTRDFGPPPAWTLEPYELLAVGAARDAEGSFAEIVLVHRSALDAEANLAALQRMFDEGESLVQPGLAWGEALTLESVGARDEVVIARVRPGSDEYPSVYRLIVQSIYQADSLLVAD